MFKSLAIKIIVGVILGWLKSFVDRIRVLRQGREEGRQEVVKSIEETNKKADEELKKMGEARADLTDDDFARELRDGYSGNKTNLPNN